MTLTSVEIIALVIIVLATIKMLVLLVKPRAWMNLTKALYKKPVLAQIVALILAGIVIYYLTQAGISIVQILAVSTFVALLFMIGFANDVGYFVKKYQDLIKKGHLWRDYWLYTLLWIALLIWGVLEIAGVI